MFRFREINEVKEDKYERNLPYLMTNVSSNNGMDKYEILANRLGVDVTRILDLPLYIDWDNEREVREYLGL